MDVKRLEKRNDINIPSYVNFGLEIECDHVDKDEFLDAAKTFSKRLGISEDSSMEHEGLEIKTPVLNNNKESIFMLKKLSKLLKTLKHDFKRGSLQVNLDDHFYNDLDRIKFLKAYAYFEPVFMRYCTGYDDEFRVSMNKYASPIFYDLKSELNHDNGLFYYTNSKVGGISFKNLKRDLIEFRLPNGCDDYSLWFNYINTFYNFQKTIENDKYDKEKVEYDFEHFDLGKYKLYSSNLGVFPADDKLYNEFVNTFFNNDYDKKYFEEQYYRKRKMN